LRQGVEIIFVHIPADFKPKSKEPLDREYMGELLDLANRIAFPRYPGDISGNSSAREVNAKG
jgi:hypothetical protein